MRIATWGRAGWMRAGFAGLPGSPLLLEGALLAVVALAAGLVLAPPPALLQAVPAGSLPPAATVLGLLAGALGLRVAQAAKTPAKTPAATTPPTASSVPLAALATSPAPGLAFDGAAVDGSAVLAHMRALLAEERRDIAALREQYGAAAQEAMLVGARLAGVALDAEARLTASVAQAEQGLLNPGGVVAHAAAATLRVERALPELAELIRRGMAEDGAPSALARMAALAENAAQSLGAVIADATGQIAALGDAGATLRDDAAMLDAAGREIAATGAAVARTLEQTLEQSAAQADAALARLPQAAEALEAAARQAADLIGEAAHGGARDMAAAAEQAAQSAAGIAEQAAQSVAGIAEQAAQSAAGIAEQAAQSAAGIAEQAAQSVAGIAEQAAQSAAGIAEQAAQSVAGTVQQTIQSMTETAEQAVRTITETARQAAQTVAEASAVLCADAAALDASGRETVLVATALQQRAECLAQQAERLDVAGHDLAAAGKSSAEALATGTGRVERAADALATAAASTTAAMRDEVAGLAGTTAVMRDEAVGLAGAARQVVALGEAARQVMVSGEAVLGRVERLLAEAGGALDAGRERLDGSGREAAQAVAELRREAVLLQAAGRDGREAVLGAAAQVDMSAAALDAAGRVIRAAGEEVAGGIGQLVVLAGQAQAGLGPRGAAELVAELKAGWGGELMDGLGGRIDALAERLQTTAQATPSAMADGMDRLGRHLDQVTAMLDAARVDTGGRADEMARLARHVDEAALRVQAELRAAWQAGQGAEEQSAKISSEALASLPQTAARLEHAGLALDRLDALGARLEQAAAALPSAAETLAIAGQTVVASLTAAGRAASDGLTAAARAASDGLAAAPQTAAAQVTAMLAARIGDAAQRLEAATAGHLEVADTLAAAMTRVQDAAAAVVQAVVVQPAGPAPSAEPPSLADPSLADPSLAAALRHLDGVQRETEVLLRHSESLAEAVLSGRAPELSSQLAGRAPALLDRLETTVRGLRSTATALALASDGLPGLAPPGLAPPGTIPSGLAPSGTAAQDRAAQDGTMQDGRRVA